MGSKRILKTLPKDSNGSEINFGDTVFVSISEDSGEPIITYRGKLIWYKNACALDVNHNGDKYIITLASLQDDAKIILADKK